MAISAAAVCWPIPASVPVTSRLSRMLSGSEKEAYSIPRLVRRRRGVNCINATYKAQVPYSAVSSLAITTPNRLLSRNPALIVGQVVVGRRIVLV